MDQNQWPRTAGRHVGMLLAVGVLSTLLACEGPRGPAGPDGPTGPRGLSHEVLVTEFGAQPGDNLNDQAAFDAAIRAAGRGGTIRVPVPATARAPYIVDSLALDDGQSLLGSDRGSIVIRAATIGRGAGVRSRHAGAQIRVSGLTFQYFQFGIDARETVGAQFEDLVADTNTVNIMMGGSVACYDLVFEKVRTWRALERDLAAFPASGSVPVNKISFRDCSFETGAKSYESELPPLLRANGGNGLTAIGFYGCEFRNGIRCEGSGGITGLTFSGNYFEGSRVHTRQVELQQAQGVAISGNYFTGWGDAGVWIDACGARGVIVAGNAFYGPADGPAVKMDHASFATGCGCQEVRVSNNTYVSVSVQLEDPRGCVTTTSPAGTPTP